MDCPKCHRQINEGNSQNPSECHGEEADDGICEAYQIIFNLQRDYREVLDALKDKSEACVHGGSQEAENLCHSWEDYESNTLKEIEKLYEPNI